MRDYGISLHPSWTIAVEGAFLAIGNAAGIAGPAYPIWVSEPLDWLPIRMNYLKGCTYWLNTKTPTKVSNVYGIDICFRTESLTLAGETRERSGMLGTAHGGIGEDVDISLKVLKTTRHRLYSVPSVLVYNSVEGNRPLSSFIFSRSTRVGTERNVVNNFRHVFAEGRLAVSFVLTY